MSPARHLTRRDLMKMSVATAGVALVRFPAPVSVFLSCRRESR